MYAYIFPSGLGLGAFMWISARSHANHIHILQKLRCHHYLSSSHKFQSFLLFFQDQFLYCFDSRTDNQTDGLSDKVEFRVTFSRRIMNQDLIRINMVSHKPNPWYRDMNMIWNPRRKSIKSLTCWVYHKNASFESWLFFLFSRNTSNGHQSTWVVLSINAFFAALPLMAGNMNWVEKICE